MSLTEHLGQAADDVKGIVHDNVVLPIQFKAAVEDVKNLKETPSNDQLLEIYALYKQATIGDCNTEKPGFLDFKGKAKWDAWNHKLGTSIDQAQQDYVNNVKELVEKVGLKE